MAKNQARENIYENVNSTKTEASIYKHRGWRSNLVFNQLAKIVLAALAFSPQHTKKHLKPSKGFDMYILRRNYRKQHFSEWRIYKHVYTTVQVQRQPWNTMTANLARLGLSWYVSINVSGFVFAPKARHQRQNYRLMGQHVFRVEVLSVLCHEGGRTITVEKLWTIHCQDMQEALGLLRRLSFTKVNLLAPHCMTPCLLACYITFPSASQNQIRKYDISLCGHDESCPKCLILYIKYSFS